MWNSPRSSIHQAGAHKVVSYDAIYITVVSALVECFPFYCPCWVHENGRRGENLLDLADLISFCCLLRSLSWRRLGVYQWTCQYLLVPSESESIPTSMFRLVSITLFFKRSVFQHWCDMWPLQPLSWQVSGIDEPSHLTGTPHWMLHGQHHHHCSK